MSEDVIIRNPIDTKLVGAMVVVVAWYLAFPTTCAIGAYRH